LIENEFKRFYKLTGVALFTLDFRELTKLFEMEHTFSSPAHPRIAD